MKKAIPAILATTGVALPIGVVLAATHSPSQQASTSTRASATPMAKRNTTTAKHTTAIRTTLRTVNGPSVDMQWGPVQVTIVVKGNVVSDLRATAPTERARSAFINQQAIPMLRQEVLQAKTVSNIKNIYGISGATMTSEAFYKSLLAALTTAHLK
jgi:uncharacterized protein with FMN-binding domain